MTKLETRMTNQARNQNDEIVIQASSLIRHSGFVIRHSRVAGLTLVELCLAMVITAMVMSALAAFSLAMASAWKGAQDVQTLTVLASQAAARLQNVIHQAKLIGEVHPGSSDGSANQPAAVLLWMNDDVVSDGNIQGAELALIEHDTATHELRYYRAGQTDGMPNWPYGLFHDAGAIQVFKAQGRTSVALTAGVQGAVFEVGSGGATTNPSLYFALKIQADSPQAAAGTPQELVQYGTAAVRAPLAQPSN